MIIIEKIELNTGAAMPRASGLRGALDWSDAFEWPDADRPRAFRRPAAFGRLAHLIG